MAASRSRGAASWCRGHLQERAMGGRQRAGLPATLRLDLAPLWADLAVGRLCAAACWTTPVRGEGRGSSDAEKAAVAAVWVCTEVAARLPAEAAVIVWECRGGSCGCKRRCGRLRRCLGDGRKATVKRPSVLWRWDSKAEAETTEAA
uniref:Uncharacterized protein n=1 Tax=Leersia perrieri TaxID=77586 RepID=A0A0D9W9X7_9ORYZ